MNNLFLVVRLSAFWTFPIHAVMARGLCDPLALSMLLSGSPGGAGVSRPPLPVAEPGSTVRTALGSRAPSSGPLGGSQVSAFVSS